MDETQKSVNLWRLETFGNFKSLDIAFKRYKDEFEELESSVNLRYMNKIPDELADNLILLYQLASYLHINLHDEVDKKMAINRNRKWKLHGDGTAQHID